MSIAVVLFLVLALIAFGALIFGARRSRIAAVVLLGFCVLLSAFSIFGFLASFEPMDAATALTAKVSYVFLFFLGATGIVWSGLKSLKSSTGSVDERES